MAIAIVIEWKQQTLDATSAATHLSGILAEDAVELVNLRWLVSCRVGLLHGDGFAVLVGHYAAFSSGRFQRADSNDDPHILNLLVGLWLLKVYKNRN